MDRRWSEEDLARVQGSAYKPPAGINGWQEAINASLQDEADIQDNAVAQLRRLGYVVMVTDNGGHNLNTPGCPDTFVSWPGANRWVAIEFKRPEASRRPGGTARPEQQKLVNRGVSELVTSVERALELAAELRGKRK